MKQIVATLMLVLFVVAVQAQKDDKQLTPQDPEAKAILDKLSTKTKGYSTITVDFEMRMVNEADGIDDSQKGTIAVKGDKYILNLAGQDVISNGTTVWAVLKEEKEVQISEAESDEEDEGIMNPKDIFTLYEKGFKYVKDDDQTHGDIAVHTIRLHPMKPGDKPYHTILLYIDKAKMQIESIEIKQKDGGVFYYKLTNFTPNKDIPDSEFEFLIPEGYEPIDLR
ncbi:outer membrane lipoprotein carrier protein LolA [bacterium SCSIO 12741]|nr:outer membrane lipoprotein carrier protein LolA [bacterium SCSIO 12741]